MKYFTIPELCTTSNANPSILEAQENPPEEVVANLVDRLVVPILDPFRELVGHLHVNSGWRCPALQSAQPLGSSTSVHPLGLAADVVPLDMAPKAAMAALVASDLPFDQAIFEKHRSVWIHVGAARPGHEPRRQALMMLGPMMLNGKLVPIYQPWNPNDPRLT